MRLRIFNLANMSFNAIRGNEILTKISEFTVSTITLCEERSGSMVDCARRDLGQLHGYRGGGQGSGPPSPEKSQKYIGFLSNVTVVRIP